MNSTHQVKPFTVDPEVMAAIRPMQARDAPQVAALHHAAMGESLWARLGPRFLSALYRQLIDDHRFLAFVYEQEGEVQGFIAGSTDPDAMMRRTFARAWFILGPAALPSMLNPGVLRRILETTRYASLSEVNGLEEIKAESLFCSFQPALRGKRISGHANKVLFDELMARGHRYVKITTEVANEGAIRQLRSWGFEERGHFQFYGKDMVITVLDMETSDRVEPRSRHPAV